MPSQPSLMQPMPRSNRDASTHWLLPDVGLLQWETWPKNHYVSLAKTFLEVSCSLRLSCPPLLPSLSALPGDSPAGSPCLCCSLPFILHKCFTNKFLELLTLSWHLPLRGLEQTFPLTWRCVHLRVHHHPLKRINLGEPAFIYWIFGYLALLSQTSLGSLSQHTDHTGRSLP